VLKWVCPWQCLSDGVCGRSILAAGWGSGHARETPPPHCLFLLPLQQCVCLCVCMFLGLRGQHAVHKCIHHAERMCPVTAIIRRIISSALGDWNGVMLFLLLSSCRPLLLPPFPPALFGAPCACLHLPYCTCDCPEIWAWLSPGAG
jgi:hypothetical protein